MGSRVKFHISLLCLLLLLPQSLSSTFSRYSPDDSFTLKSIGKLSPISSSSSLDSRGLSVQSTLSTDTIVEDFFKDVELEPESFDLDAIESETGSVRPTLKTGTTIAGVVYSGGVVLGADTRATGGEIVRDTNCAKIHQLTEKVWVCGAGTSADVDFCVRKTATQLEFLDRQNGPGGPSVRVAAACSLLKRQLLGASGKLSVALVLGGRDPTGNYLYQLSVDGASDRVQYTALGSGSLAATAVLEGGFKPDLSQEEAIKLVQNAILAGISNDLGSGSNIDICIITATKVEYLRNYVKEPAGRPVNSPSASAGRYSSWITKGRIKKVPQKKHTNSSTEKEGDAPPVSTLSDDDEILQAVLKTGTSCLGCDDEIEFW
mmetsp:Transcript_15466/g.19381  ORF Transcript_15466/g.19381 Transcript_15466/m.19381 type:complete len:375 (+) Transcript_15466:40-1164(+)